MSGLDGLGWPTPDNVKRERDQQPASAGCHPTTCSPWSDAPETLHEWRKSETLRPDPRSKRMANHAVKLERERDEARGQLAGIEERLRVELGGHPDSELWGDAGLIAATMRCVDALDVVTGQRDRLAEALRNLCDEFLGNKSSRDITAQLLEAFKALQSLNQPTKP